MTEPEPVRIELAGIRFAWDELKDQANLARHGVEFSEAATVFLDPLALYLEAETVEGEIRDSIVGWSLARRTLLVVHTERGTMIRIISARVPTAIERVRYEEGSG